MKKIYNPLITVCDKCYRACCWQGEFMCEDSVTAGITEKPVRYLISRMKRGFDGEHPDYWQKDLDGGHRQLLTKLDLMALGLMDKDMLELSL